MYFFCIFISTSLVKEFLLLNIVVVLGIVIQFYLTCTLAEEASCHQLSVCFVNLSHIATNYKFNTIVIEQTKEQQPNAITPCFIINPLNK